VGLFGPHQGPLPAGLAGFPRELSLTSSRAIAAALERGVDPPLGAALSAVWSRLAAARLRRSDVGADLGLPPGAMRVVGVAGATLGGSWKTPSSISLAAALAGRGARVAVVSHGYQGAGRGEARRVAEGDRPVDVGDEAALARRVLAHLGVPVVSGRRGAGRLLEREADILIADGLLRRGQGERVQTLLCLDAERPFGAGRCPPCGDLVAPVGALLESARHVLVVGDRRGSAEEAAQRRALVGSLGHGSVHEAGLSLEVPDGVGNGASCVLVTAIARPRRLVASLARRGVAPLAHLALPDHGASAVGQLARALGPLTGCELVLATAKCALWLPASVAGRPVLELGLGLELPGSLLDALLSG
jgi:tetraacyldisaccharide 4'-kinase